MSRCCIGTVAASLRNLFADGRGAARIRPRLCPGKHLVSLFQTKQDRECCETCIETGQRDRLPLAGLIAAQRTRWTKLRTGRPGAGTSTNKRLSESTSSSTRKRQKNFESSAKSKARLQSILRAHLDRANSSACAENRLRENARPYLRPTPVSYTHLTLPTTPYV